MLDKRPLKSAGISHSAAQGEVGADTKDRCGAYTKFVTALSFPEARSTILREVRARYLPRAVEEIGLGECMGRVLAEDIATDRDYPPFNRSARDGFAVRAGDIPGTVRLVGEVRAGETFRGFVNAGEAVEIMTGAPAPEGADAVVMVEHCEHYDDGTVHTDRACEPGANIAARGCDARAGSVVLARGTRIDYSAVSWLATTGHARVRAFTQPAIAVLATGDEIVDVDREPATDQIRNSNAWSLAAQVRRAGAIPAILPIAGDKQAETRALIERGLEADMLLLSGGVSAGRYDVVEPALADLGAEFFFDRVRIQPGQPVVFGRVREKFFFGLPGNPGSTMVTFEILARAAVDLISGASETPLPMTLARLTQAFRHKTGITRFLPAHVECGEVTPIAWQGSGDVPSLCRANAFLVADADRPEYALGETIPVLLK
jgi:molybdopterin molybdotransferase